MTMYPKGMKEVLKFRCVLFLSYLSQVLSYEVATLCDSLQCGGKGACVRQRNDDDSPFKCVCVPGYHGRWCQLLVAVTGAWSSWTPWSPCEHPSRGCVKYPRARQRECNNPVPQNNGKYCQGDHVDYERCPFPLCSTAIAWSPWTPCFPVCGNHSRRLRHRNCTVLETTWDECDGKKIEVVRCTAPQCPGKKNKSLKQLPKAKTKIKENNRTKQDVNEDERAGQHNKEESKSSKLKENNSMKYKNVGQYNKEESKSSKLKELNITKQEETRDENIEQHGEESQQSSIQDVIQNKSASEDIEESKSVRHHIKEHKSMGQLHMRKSHHDDNHVAQQGKEKTAMKQNDDKDILFSILFIGSVLFLGLIFLAYVIQDRKRNRTFKYKQMMEELVRNDKELATKLSDIDGLENIIETPISPNVGGALHQNSSTVIQVGKTKFDRHFSYIPPLPHISRKQSHLLHKNQLKDFNSNANVQVPSTNGLKTALSCSDTQGTRPMSVSRPRVVPNETQETVDGRKVFCGMLNSLLDNWMEDKGLTQDETSLVKQPAKIQEARQEVMSPGKQPITLETTKQEVTSTEAPATNDCLQDGDLVSFVDAILTAADHGRLKQAKLMKNSNPKK